MRRTLIIVSLGLVGLLAVAGSNARPLKSEEEARITPVGKPINCIRIAQIDETRVRNDHTIDFYMLGGKVYRNNLPNSCSQLGFEERFSYKTSTQELCSSDIITVLTGPGVGQGPVCGLGDFQEVTGAPKGH
jgi:hypothetical protein